MLSSTLHVARCRCCVRRATAGRSLRCHRWQGGSDTRIARPIQRPSGRSLASSRAIELGPDNIRVNAIQPGIVKGPRIERVIAARAEQLGLSYEQMEKEYLAKISLRRMTTPEEVAATALF